MNRIQTLGDQLGAAFAAHDFDEAAFPELAARALVEARLDEGFDARALLHALVTSDPGLEQGPGGFADAAAVVYRGRGFYLEILYWLDGTTTLHEHAFSGAFQVLAGSSVHTTYDFALERRVRSTLRLGRLAPREVELLRRGAVRPIVSGPGFIHALFHLERPSVTLVARTVNEHDRLPQLNYLPPGVGFDPFEVDRLRDRRSEALTLLRETDPPALHAAMEEVARTADLPALFHALRHLATPFHDVAALAHWAALAEPRHGAAMGTILAALHEQVRRLHLTERRAAVRDPGLRYFLALLLNVPTRADLVRLLREAGVEDPSAAIPYWLTAMARTRDERTTTVLDLTFTHEPGGAERCVAILAATARALVTTGLVEDALRLADEALGGLSPGDAEGITGLARTIALPTSPLAVLAR